jgi:hypothetical protein
MSKLKTYRRHRGRAELIINLCCSWKWVVDFVPWSLHPQYSLNLRTDGPQSRSGRFGEERNLLLLLGAELWIVQPVTYFTPYATPDSPKYTSAYLSPDHVTELIHGIFVVKYITLTF